MHKLVCNYLYLRSGVATEQNSTTQQSRAQRSDEVLSKPCQHIAAAAMHFPPPTLISDSRARSGY
jgi:hypothetical protein